MPTMSDALESAFNAQLSREFASELAYLQMSAYCDCIGFPGFAHWLRIQADEEREHAMRLFDYILERGNQVHIHPLEAPRRDFEDILDVFQTAYEHEQSLSKNIQELFSLAHGEQDFASFPLLQWFVTEQVEEENLFDQLTRQLALIDGDGPALLILDRELGSRTDADPVVDV